MIFTSKRSTAIATLPARRLAATATPSTIARPRDTDGAAQYSKDTTAQTYFGRQLDDLNRNFQVKKEVFTKLGRTLDDLFTGYRGDNQGGHRATAQHLVLMVLEHHTKFLTKPVHTVCPPPVMKRGAHQCRCSHNVQLRRRHLGDPASRIAL